MTNKPIVFFHLGIERTATTYLQDAVFPHFKNIGYIHKRHYADATAIISQQKYKHYLVSYELNLNEQFEREVRNFSSIYPHAIPIMVLRPQAQWLVSQYKRFVKNGNPQPFHRFFNLQNRDSLYPTQALLYTHRIELLKNYFTTNPLLFFYHDFRQQPQQFIQQLAHTVNATVHLSDINSQKIHTSYTTQQLLALQYVMQYINLKRERKFRQPLLHFGHRLAKDAVRYTTFAIANQLPAHWFEEQAFISSETLNAITQYYQDDWNTCLQYINPTSFQNP